MFTPQLFCKVIKVLSGEKTHFMSDPSKEFSEDWQKTGSGISLVAISQVRSLQGVLRWLQCRESLVLTCGTPKTNKYNLLRMGLKASAECWQTVYRRTKRHYRSDQVSHSYCLKFVRTWLQTGNDARVVVAGSMEAFSNTFLQATNIKTKQGQV